MRSIGHHEAMAELVRQHDDERPYAPDAGVAGAAHPVGREVYPAHHQGRVGMLHLED